MPSNNETAGRSLLADVEAPASDLFTRHGYRKHHEGHKYHPKTVLRVVTRIQALTLELLPIQVDLDDITSPTSSIITKDVIEAYSSVAGDFYDCLPFALLEARRYFARQQRINPSDADENAGRKLACEALARKIVARTPMQDQYGLLSRRFTIVESDGDESLPLSALESAVDQHATFFLSSNEAQRCVFALWKGLLIQTQKGNENIEYQIYKVDADQQGFLAHFDPARISVPRYQFFIRIALWIVFLACYTIALQTPDRGFGPEDVLLFVQVVGYVVEDVVKVWKIGWWACVSFWQIINILIYTFATVAFVFRCFDLATTDPAQQDRYRYAAFQWLSLAAPLVWAKLLTVFDLYRFFGVTQIVIWRMLKESAVFCLLLAIFAIGFLQALTGLDIADERRDSTHAVVHSLIQAVLGSPNFDFYDSDAASYPFGIILYYAWSIATIVILLNVLVALFSSAYEECVDESEPTFLAFFAGKTVAAIRAPDEFVYPAPFNLIELCILPLEFCLSKESYARLNRVLMTGLFFLPLGFIALWETHLSPLRQKDMRDLLVEPDEYQQPEEDPEPFRTEDGEEDEYDHAGEPEGMQISKVKFEDLKKKLPNLERSVAGETLYQLLDLKKELASLRAEIASLRNDEEKRKEEEEKARKAGEAAKEERETDLE
ncbi:Calcium channel YVC1 [Rhodotorula toruloides]|nr:Calcium channel YVC1 [Rhodotorula toruloides]